MGKLGPLDTENALKQQSNDTQGTATHIGLLSKKTCKPHTILLVVSLFLLWSNNSMKQTSQQQMQQSNKKALWCFDNSLTTTASTK